MSKEILSLTKKYQTNPELIKIQARSVTVPSIDQFYYNVPSGKKNEVLSHLLNASSTKRSMVFCNTKSKVDELVKVLQMQRVFL